MLHGPISQWLQTVAILFSVMLMIPVWSLVWNFLATMKGQWHQLKDNVPIKFLMTGHDLLSPDLLPGPDATPAEPFNAIVSKTDWIVGHAHMAVLGAFSFFAIGAALLRNPAHAQGRLSTPESSRTRRSGCGSSAGSRSSSRCGSAVLQGLQWNDTTIPSSTP